MPTSDTQVTVRTRSVVVDFDSGVASGYVADLRAPQLANYLRKFSKEPRGLALKVAELCVDSRISILKSLSVDEEARGMGIGNELLETFVEKSEGAPVLLIADRFENQADGFVLTNWYERHGFEVIEDLPAGPLMLRR